MKISLIFLHILVLLLCVQFQVISPSENSSTSFFENSLSKSGKELVLEVADNRIAHANDFKVFIDVANVNAHHINVVYKYDDSKVEVDGPEIIYFENNSLHLIAGRVQDLYDVEILVIFELFDENNLLIQILEKTIYIFSTNEFDYISTISKDHTMELYFDNNDLYQAYLSENNGANFKVSFNRGITPLALNNFTISGDVTWQDVNGVVHPAKNVKVSVVGSTSTPIKTGYTNQNGHYSLSFNKNNNPIIAVYVSPVSSSINVETSTGGSYNLSDGQFHMISSLSALTLDMNATNNNTLGKSFEVHQSIYLAETYYKSLSSSTSSVTVNFPYNATYFNPNDGEIYILEQDAHDWDVSMHEYGHYVADDLGIASTGGQHSFSQNLVDIAYLQGYSDPWTQGIMLAWSEGWATYFAISAQVAQSASSLGIPNLGDLFYSDTEDTSINIPIENISTQGYFSEANEYAIIAFLWDIADNSPSESSDPLIAYGHEELFELYMNVQFNYLWGCVSSLYGQTINASALGYLLTYFQFSANLIGPSNNATMSSSSQTFSWQFLGGTLDYTSNNQYRLMIIDYATGATIYASSYTTNTQITLNQTQVQSIINNYDQVIWFVYVIHDDTNDTGPYMSEWRILNT